MVECANLIAGRTDRCHPRCERALIGLISSEEGKELINCECEGSKFCEQSKERIEVCRNAVYTAVAKDSIVSCSTATWICSADPLCSTAMEYYRMYCRGLFHGHKCTHRCNNSLSILNRQEKAAKLRTCYCDGTEDFPCDRVKYNTERYCYGRTMPPQTPSEEFDPEEEDRENSIAFLDDTSGNRAIDYRRRKHQFNKNGPQYVSSASPGHHSLIAALLAILVALF